MPELLSRKETLEDIFRRADFLHDIIETSESEEEREGAQADLEILVAVTLPRKSDGIAGWIKHCEAQQKAAKEMEAWARIAYERWTKREERMRHITRVVMQRNGYRSMKGSVFCINLREGSPSVEFDLGALPLEYCEIPVPVLRVKKDKIRQAMKDGITVPGAWKVTGDDVVVIR